MRRLSSLDAQFLSVENATTMGHVGGVVLLDPAEVSGGQLTLDRIREVVEPRLHLMPVLRQRLVTVPMNMGWPYWADDPDFDLEFHLREIALPDPGDNEHLAEQLARIHARPLDRSRPLWELYLVHNLADGDQALYTKIHHAAIDGISGAELLATLMDDTVDPPEIAPPEHSWEPTSLPGWPELLGRGLTSVALQPLAAARILPRALPHLTDFPGASLIPGAEMLSDAADSVVKAATSGSGGRAVGRRTVSTPPTRLNQKITAHRRFGFGTVPLSEVKDIKDTLDMTVNDVVMALCTSILRRWLLDHDGLPDTPLVVAVPVSVRGADDSQSDSEDDAEIVSGGNQVSVMLAQIPTHVADPGERLDAIQAEMAEAKEQFDAVPASLLSDVTSTIPTALSGLAAKAAFHVVAMGGLPFNLFISNVPGPQHPLYIGGARVRAVYPMSAVSDLTGALNITVFSYDGSLDFGFIACRELVPDVWKLVDYLQDALTEIRALVVEDD